MNLDKLLAEADDEIGASYKATFRFRGTLLNGIELIPFIIAFPHGAIGAGMALFAFAPSGVTPTILLLYFFPFATLLLFVGTSSMVQLAGDIILALFLICFYVSDFIMHFLYNSIIAGKVEDLSTNRTAKTRLGTNTLFMVWLLVTLIVVMSQMMCIVWHYRRYRSHQREL